MTPAIIALILLVAWFSHRYAWWRPAVPYRHPRILMYHMIRTPVKGAKFNSLRVSPDDFDKQISYLKDQGWTFMTMSELIKHHDQLPLKTVAITFDDGYADNYHHALPILQKYNAKATIYLVVDRHYREWSSKRKKKNRSGELQQEPKLSDEQVREMLTSDLIEFGSHTMTHDNLPTLDKDGKQREIIDSRTTIAQTFGIPCEAFCYPFGLYDETDVTLVKQAGYSNATTVEKGISTSFADLYRLKRITISGKDSFLAFKLKMRTGKRGVKK